MFDFAPPAAHVELLARLRERAADLSELLEAVSGEWVAEDLVYRFWHQSFKAYLLQDHTLRIAALLRECSLDGTLHPWFEEIVASGTGHVFDRAHNDDWTTHTRPIVEAFFHARFMLEMAARYATTLEHAPSMLPSGWAALLELYSIR